MVYRYEHRLVFAAAGASLTLPVAPEVLDLVTTMAARHPAWTLQTILEALETAWARLETQARVEERVGATPVTQAPMSQWYGPTTWQDNEG